MTKFAEFNLLGGSWISAKKGRSVPTRAPLRGKVYSPMLPSLVVQLPR